MGVIDTSNTVKELLEAIAKKELKVKDVAELYGVSERTIQTKIKKLGCVWSHKEAVYEFKGTDDSVLAVTIDEAFKPSVRVVKGSEGNSNKPATKKVTGTSKGKSKNKGKLTNTSNSTSTNMDNIDRLLAGKKAIKREYKGFYLDGDVVSVLDSVDSGIKSELVNECLRKVFKEKGLL